MPKPYRYTGSFPPIDVLAQFPDWENAIDEEGEDGQYETTLRPADQQTYIGEWVTFTAADAWLASGEHCPAMGYVIDSVDISSLYVFNGDDWWELRYDLQTQLWRPFVADYIPTLNVHRQYPSATRPYFHFAFPLASPSSPAESHSPPPSIPMGGSKRTLPEALTTSKESTEVGRRSGAESRPSKL